jgi:hypothetical protein
MRTVCATSSSTAAIWESVVAEVDRPVAIHHAEQRKVLRRVVDDVHNEIARDSACARGSWLTAGSERRRPSILTSQSCTAGAAERRDVCRGRPQNVAVTYWLVNSGTTEEPWLEDVLEQYRAWNRERGDLQMLPFRPDRWLSATSSPPHRGFTRLRTRRGRRVTAPAHPSGDERWPASGAAPAPRLRHTSSAPTAQRAGIAPRDSRDEAAPQGPGHWPSP